MTVGTEQAIQFLRNRRSIQHYQNHQVDKTTIESLIKGARYAPTDENSQLVQWTVFTDPAQLKKIAAQTVDCLRDIVTTQPKETYPAYFPMILAGWDNGFRSHSLFLLLTSTQLTRPWRQFYIFLSGYILWGRFSVGHLWSAHPLLYNSFFDQNFVHTFSTIPPIFRVISENSLSYMFLDREPLWY